MQLTDEMINKVLRASHFATRSSWKTVIILSIVVIVFVVLFFKVKDKKIKIPCALLAVVFVVIGVNNVAEDFAYKKAIQNEDWLVVTDTVDRVMESKTYGKTTGYFMVLEEYGRVSFDSYSEAAKHYPGEQVYVVVIPNGDKYMHTGFAYSKAEFEYIGNHK